MCRTALLRWRRNLRVCLADLRRTTALSSLRDTSPKTQCASEDSGAAGSARADRGDFQEGETQKPTYEET
jgi:hypothetical protein